MISRWLVGCLLSVALVGLSSDEIAAQNNSREFVESSSPLSNGDRVISRSEEGRAVQTVITVSAESLARRSEAAQRDRIDLSPLSQQVQDAASNTQTSQASSDRYPYPAPARVASNAAFRNPAAANAATANRTAATAGYQLPTLGIGNLTTARRTQLFQDCCNPQTFGSVQAQVPAAQAPRLLAPATNLNVPSPAQFGGFQQPIAFQQPAFQQPVQQPFFNAATQPQFGFQNNSRWWTPFVTGSGVYQPIVRLANIKPGTYLGQGIIGQPTAYVDGQPVRNLLRYVFP